MDYILDKIKIGERIRTLRENMLLSRERFSEMVDISPVFLGQIERGECLLSLKTLSNIVSFTGVSSDYILFGDSEPTPTIKKIVRILNNSSDDTVDLVYNIVNNIYHYNKKKLN